MNKLTALQQCLRKNRRWFWVDGGVYVLGFEKCGESLEQVCG